MKIPTLKGNERWVPSYEGFYSVDNRGNVFSWANDTCLLLKQYVNKKDLFPRVSFCVNYKRKTWSVPVLVYTTFHGKVPAGLKVTHINGNKSDNRLENLTLTTHKEICNRMPHRINIAEKNAVALTLIDMETNEEKSFASVTGASVLMGFGKPTVSIYISNAVKKGLDYITLNGRQYKFIKAA